MGPKANPSDPFAELKTFMENSMSELKGMIESLKTDLATKTAEVSQLKDKVTVLEERVSLQDAEIADLKNYSIMAEQATRGSAIRIFGICPQPEDVEALGEAKAIAKKAYERAIKPILLAAKAKGSIDTVPQLNTCLETAYAAGKATTDAQGRSMPPPVVVIFNSKPIRDVVMRHKKGNIPVTTAAEKAAGVGRIVLVEDLVPAIHKKVKEMSGSGNFEKVWTINGHIRYTLPGDNTVRKVPSPFINISELLPKK
jgi:hypothetical protein